MNDGFHEEVPTVPLLGKNKNVSVWQGQGNMLSSVVTEHRQDKEQDHAYDVDGSARTTLGVMSGLMSVSSGESELTLEVLDSESTTEDDVVEVIDLIDAETVPGETSGGGRSPKGPSDYMGKPKQGHERASRNSGIRGCHVGRSINDEEQHHAWVQFLKDGNTFKGSRNTSIHAASERRENRTDKSICEELEPVNSFNSHDLSVKMEEFYKTQRALVESYNLKKREGHQLAGQGQITSNASDYLALMRESFEVNHVSFVFVVHKEEGLLLKRIRDGSLLRYEVPGGMVSESDYVKAGKVSVLPLSRCH
jgi:Uri superfamily endonuclease